MDPYYSWNTLSTLGTLAGREPMARPDIPKDRAALISMIEDLKSQMVTLDNTPSDKLKDAVALLRKITALRLRLEMCELELKKMG